MLSRLIPGSREKSKTPPPPAPLLFLKLDDRPYNEDAQPDSSTPKVLACSFNTWQARQNLAHCPLLNQDPKYPEYPGGGARQSPTHSLPLGQAPEYPEHSDADGE